MDIVVVTTLERTELLEQTIDSMVKNAEGWSRHKLVVVCDLSGEEWDVRPSSLATKMVDRVIIHPSRKGASASRNVGAASIPRNHRQRLVMFSDDDCYYCPGWDVQMEGMLAVSPRIAVSGHAHPYNLPASEVLYMGRCRARQATVLSTVQMAMPWRVWDEIGGFMEPGGPGGSEDVEWCGRAVYEGVKLYVAEPQCVIHCGLTSTSGKQIVGYELMVKQNAELLRLYNLHNGVRIV